MGTKGKSWTCNEWALVRQKERYGEIQDSNRQVESLPPIGAKVYVLVRHNYSKTRKGLTAKYELLQQWKDAHGAPALFTVTAYTSKINDPLDKKNLIRLSRYDKYGNLLYHSYIKAIEVAIGWVDLLPEGECPAIDALRDNGVRVAEYGVKSGVKVEHGNKVYVVSRKDNEDEDDEDE